MAKENSESTDLGVYRKGDKYYCAQCNTEIPLRQACPNCKKEINWDRVLMELHL